MKLYTLLALDILLIVLLAVPGKAQSVPERGATKIDCSDVKVDYTDDPSLTPDEKLRLMDQAFLRSLSKYDVCATERAKADAAANSSGNAVGGGDGLSGLDGLEEAGEGGSVASSGMSGTEPQTQASATTDGEQNYSSVDPKNDWSNPDASDQGNTADKTQNQQASNNGKIPEDISPADNDSVLERQIREAAMNEQDPQTRAKLWAEYRKYKGLPPVK